MLIELFRSWCFECPEVEFEHSEQLEEFRIQKKLFAIINNDQISIKCVPDIYAQAILHPHIAPTKDRHRYHWITITDVTQLSIEDLHEYLIHSYELIVQELPQETQRRLLEKLVHDIDSPWKDVLDTSFQEFISFFYPEIYKDIDWTKAPLFLDKELRQIIKASKTGRRYVDKLVKVYRKTGEERWVLSHIEVQGQPQEIFPERMFIYSNRLFDVYQMKVASLAILADDNPDWRPTRYEDELWGSRKIFEFPSVKLLDYKDKWEDLKNSDNPFAIVVMAHLKMLETKGNFTDRLYWKIEISKMLYSKGYNERKIFALLKFIDWLMVLPKKLSSSYHSTMHQVKEEKKMKFLTTFELFAKEEGREEGMEKGREEGMEKGTNKGKILGQIEALQQMLKMRYLPKNQFDQMIQPLQIELAKIA
jgi:predicted DNA-binding protein (MmcQ/YjbR family)